MAPYANRNYIVTKHPVHASTREPFRLFGHRFKTTFCIIHWSSNGYIPQAINSNCVKRPRSTLVTHKQVVVAIVHA